VKDARLFVDLLNDFDLGYLEAIVGVRIERS
jgi:hypothetical protein